MLNSSKVSNNVIIYTKRKVQNEEKNINLNCNEILLPTSELLTVPFMLFSIVAVFKNFPLGMTYLKICLSLCKGPMWGIISLRMLQGIGSHEPPPPPPIAAFYLSQQSQLFAQIDILGCFGSLGSVCSGPDSLLYSSFIVTVRRCFRANVFLLPLLLMKITGMQCPGVTVSVDAWSRFILFVYFYCMC